ncbi:MAG: hypothetical protein L0Z71_19225 [Anaerolineae bacterium]|nr:hypothetical protein [Anaerolineae bacterium]
MKKEDRLLGWLIVNLILISGSLLMTWFILGFEPPPALMPIAGWDFIFTQIAISMELLSEYGFAWLWILNFIQGVSGIFVVGYVVFRIFSIITKTKSRTGGEVLSIALMATMAVFLLSDFAFGSIRLPWPGYWLFILGVLSSAIFEWKNARKVLIRDESNWQILK